MKLKCLLFGLYFCLIMLLCSCAIERSGSETTDTIPETETRVIDTIAVDDAAEYEKRVGQVGYRENSKYQYAPSVITEAKEYIPPFDLTIMLTNQSQYRDSNIIIGSGGDTFYYDKTPYEEYSKLYDAIAYGNNPNGIIRITQNGKKERICVDPECTVDSVCPHMEFLNEKACATENALYFVCQKFYTKKIVCLYVLEFNLESRELNKIAEIPGTSCENFVIHENNLFITYYNERTGKHGVSVIDTDKYEMYISDSPAQLYGIVKGELLTCSRGYGERYYTIKLYDPVFQSSRTISDASPSSSLWAIDRYIYYSVFDNNTDKIAVFNIATNKSNIIGQSLVRMEGTKDRVYYLTRENALYYCSTANDGKNEKFISLDVTSFSVTETNVLYVKRESSALSELEYQSWTFDNTTGGWKKETKTRYYAEPIKIFSYEAEGSRLIWTSDGIHLSGMRETISGGALYLYVYCPADTVLDRIPAKYLRIPLNGNDFETIDELWG